MIHLIVDAKTGKTTRVDDGLPDIPPVYDPSKAEPEPIWLNIPETAQLVKELKTARVELDELKAKVSKLEKAI